MPRLSQCAPSLFYSAFDYMLTIDILKTLAFVPGVPIVSSVTATTR